MDAAIGTGWMPRCEFLMEKVLASAWRESQHSDFLLELISAFNLNPLVSTVNVATESSFFAFRFNFLQTWVLGRNLPAL